MNRRAMWCALAAVAGCTSADNSTGELDRMLASVIVDQGIEPLDPGPAAPAARVSLGEALFFDPILGGNLDIACATCHHPAAHTADALTLGAGTGGHGVGVLRQLGDDRAFIPRNATDVFNRGAAEWATMFWDGRVDYDPLTGAIKTPAGDALPALVAKDALAAQAMFPVTSRDEMRGASGDHCVDGTDNAVAALPDTDFTGMWKILAGRLKGNATYRGLFASAYPDVPVDDLGYEHAALAIADYERTTFRYADTPWDRYVAGDHGALSDRQKAGAVLFFGKARCSGCHAGPLFTDQSFHNLCAPQFGPGKGDAAPEDFGHGGVTKSEADRYSFRTPPLHNVALTGPYMHDGAYQTLDAAVRHHMDPAHALRTYDITQVPEVLRPTLISDEVHLAAMSRTVDPLLADPPALSSEEIADLVAFLNALTDPRAVDMTSLVPASVPSGLPVAY